MPTQYFNNFGYFNIVMLVYLGTHIGLPLRVSYSFLFLWVCSGQADPAPTVNGWMLSGAPTRDARTFFFVIGVINRRGGPMCPPVFVFVDVIRPPTRDARTSDVFRKRFSMPRWLISDLFFIFATIKTFTNYNRVRKLHYGKTI